MFLKKVVDKIKTNILYPITFCETRAVYKIRSKNMVKPVGLQTTSLYGAYELHAESGRLCARTRIHTPTRPDTRTHTHTQICNI
jgi:hypothetical protein